MIEVKRLDVSCYMEEIKSLFAAVFIKEPWNDDWSDPEQLHRYISDLTGNVNSLSLGLFEDGRLAGISLGSVLHWCSGTEYYIFEFCVEEKRQGRGLGSAFLKKVEQYAKAQQIAAVFLETRRNVPAFAFYQKNGFAELKDYVCLYKGIS
ncbi:MAG: GNAT family N-acetyltransferase [Treponema sp.]|nr:GNAT family N-acetyltransferase [Treponema sp.]